MSVPFAIAINVVIWWTVLFAILPIGVRTQGEDGLVVPGTPASAPTRPRLLRVVLLTTLVSCLVFGALWAGIKSGVIDLEKWLGRPSI
jgi:predicted secreted protein